MGIEGSGGSKIVGLHKAIMLRVQTRSMDPLLKTVFVNLPVSIPEPWRQFFDRTAGQLGCSRNAAICLALKLGGPLLSQHVVTMREQLRAECQRVKDARQVSKILGLPPQPRSRVRSKAR